MSSPQTAAAAAVMVVSLGSAAIEVITPPPQPSPIRVERLEWDEGAVVYERSTETSVHAAWAAAVATEQGNRILCQGDGLAVYEIGRITHVWTLDVLTEDGGCEDRIPPGVEVYALVTLSPLDGRPGVSKRTKPFTIGD